MRKLWVVPVAAAFVMLAASPAGASDQLSADQLVRKLVKAGVCTNRTPVNAVGTKVQCTDPSISPPLDIVVTAFPKRSAMLRDLDRERASLCAGNLPGVTLTIPPRTSVDYLVGPNWWTPPFGGSRQRAILRALGGKLRTFACD